MVVSGKKNSVWILENCLLPELKAINPSTDPGYLTDLNGNAKIPDYDPTAQEKIQAEFTRAAILCWLRGAGGSSTARGGLVGGNRHWSFEVFFQGGTKVDRHIQVATLQLVEDHRRAMDLNPQRDQPSGGTALNVWGVNTTLSEDYAFHWERMPEGIGMWTCAWRIDYQEPTTG